MKFSLKVIFTSLLLLLNIIISAQSQEKIIASCCSTEEGRGCTGSAYCTACSNCSGCRHCAKNGGTCGVCAGGRTSKTSYKRKRSKSKSYRPNSYTSSTTYHLQSYTNGTLLTVTNEKLNVRKGAGTKYPIIEQIKKGDKVKFIEQKGNWYKVQVIDSENIGYVYYKYLKE